MKEGNEKAGGLLVAASLVSCMKSDHVAYVWQLGGENKCFGPIIR
jgi:hypothetical protein